MLDAVLLLATLNTTFYLWGPVLDKLTPRDDVDL